MKKAKEDPMLGKKKKNEGRGVLFPAVVIMGGGYGLMVVIGAVDYLIGTSISLALLYIVPIVLIAVDSTTTGAICAAIGAALCWFFSDLIAGNTYVNLYFGIWDAISRVGLLLSLSLSISSLIKSRKREKQVVRIDALTEIPNSVVFRETAEVELNRMRRFHRPLTVAYLDFDDFNLVNSSLGHTTGDRLLRETACVLRDMIRAVDVIARLGGDELVLLFPETDPEQAKIVVAKIQKGIGELAGKYGAKVSTSIGVVTYFSPPSSVDEILKDADELMYEAKKAGKALARYAVIN